MKKLLLIVLLLISRNSFAAIANVQCKTDAAWSSGTTWDTTFGSSVTSGNLITVLAQVHLGGVNTTLSISDGTNTYTRVDATRVNADANGTWMNAVGYYAKNVTGGTITITATVSSSANAIAGRLLACEWSGADTSSPLDQATVNNQINPGTGTDAVSSGSITPSTDGQLVIGASVSMNGNEIWAKNTSYTAIGSTSNDLSLGEYIIQTSAASTAVTYTATFGTLHTFNTMIMTFKPQSSATGGSNLLLLRGGR